MKTREWILIIILVVLGQMLLHFVAFDFAGSGRALGYISIAGTIVSIVLGMIAIIYSFVQSVTHSNSVSDMRSQVQKLVEVGNGISELEGNLQRSARKINKATKGLVERIVENTSVAKDFAEKVSSITFSYNKEGAHQRVTGKNGGYSSDWVLMDICHLMVVDVIEMNMDLSEFQDKVIEPFAKDVGYAADFLSGALNVTSIRLVDEGIIKLSGGGDVPYGFVKLSGFDEYMAALKEEAKTSSVKEIAAYVSCVEKVSKS